MTETEKQERELIIKINRYFDEKESPGDAPRTRTRIDVSRSFVSPVTLSGLSAAIGMERRRLVELRPSDRFYEVLQTAKSVVESYAEEQLFSGKSAPGIIFSLKANFGWHEDCTVESYGDGLSRIFDEMEFSAKPFDELKKLAAFE